MSLFFRIYKHLLPRGKAWSITINKKLRQFIDGLTTLPSDIKLYFDQIYGDLFPDTTRELSSWELQWGLRDVDLTEQQRRDRLDATWKALGGQSPRYIQDTLQQSGFDVYVHEWWEPESNPPIVRNPLYYLDDGFHFAPIFAACGEPDALCGEPDVQANNPRDREGYPLVNKISEVSDKYVNEILCGEAITLCGESTIVCGDYSAFNFTPKRYIIPDDPEKWPYFLYIGDLEFPNVAEVPIERRNEFETLMLKICPTQVWIGVLVRYV